ncbi:MAG: glycerol-3-phosphate 1-O-acyltransferase PlsY [Legionellales bacterium]|nr:glycerol-3-phosphate 1-O-acyltransferase PlsY [Legionellales bacterium]
MWSIVLFLICTLTAYLVGSICSAVIVGRLFDLPDPRQEGSQNPGATNVLRLAGKKYAIMVLLADMLKGLLPVLMAHVLTASITLLGLTCLAAVLGHIYPIFFNFKGGKGVATAIGALLGFHFLLGALVIVIWVLVAYTTRYSSLASLISITLAPLFAMAFSGSIFPFLPLLMMAVLILYQHLDNIKRLLDGQETKINLGSS